MKHTKLVCVLLIFSAIGQQTFAQDSLFQWHGYIQTRLSSNFNATNEISIRRAKLWIEGNVPTVNWLSYKMQAVYRSQKDANITLQDAFAKIRLKNAGSIRVGRFIPDFILQRQQADYEIPDLERADVVNGLVFNPRSMARQTGAQLTLENSKFPVILSIGVFNENHDVPGGVANQNFLYTTHAQFTLKESDDIFIGTGASFGYRFAENTAMPFIYGTDDLISGNDMRYGIEGQLEFYKFGIQSEFIQANIRNDKIWGYYVGSDYKFTEKFQATAGIEKFANLIPNENKNAWFGFGGNYFFTEKTKLMAEIKSQKDDHRYNYQIEFQLQVFFN